MDWSKLVIRPLRSPTSHPEQVNILVHQSLVSRARVAFQIVSVFVRLLQSPDYLQAFPFGILKTDLISHLSYGPHKS